MTLPFGVTDSLTAPTLQLKLVDKLNPISGCVTFLAINMDSHWTELSLGFCYNCYFFTDYINKHALTFILHICVCKKFRTTTLRAVMLSKSYVPTHKLMKTNSGSMKMLQVVYYIHIWNTNPASTCGHNRATHQPKSLKCEHRVKGHAAIGR